MNNVNQVSILIFGSKYPPATLHCTSSGINAAIDYVSCNDISDAQYDAIVVKFKQAATYYLRKSIGDLIDNLMDSLTALGALCVMLYEIDPIYSQLTSRIHTLMQDSQNLFNFDALENTPMMPRRGEPGYISD
ncbi:hypothetical protein D5b_00340 [Faustovirus]|nr:hypothetical protein D5b_00340 [Faustovirus]AMN84573.1 hypothetical protein D6_00167 [Faustovirus]AMP44285.1 hypothetical protein PRJ_Dakar_00332 [Faustovirus]QKE50272.1 hypothetical protein F-VV10_0152 [Faustovirus]